ncbi:DMT family transporter [Blautia sp. RD014234]|nr:DMT family transporter [Blautia parvula]
MDKTKGKTIGLLAMVVVVTIYGVSYISRAVISEYLPTVVILVIQMAVMTILFTGFNLVTGKNMKVKKKDWGIIILSGLVGTTFFHGFTILSVTSIGATVSSLLLDLPLSLRRSWKSFCFTGRRQSWESWVYRSLLSVCIF